MVGSRSAATHRLAAGWRQEEFPDDPYGTITGTVWNLDTRFPQEIYKPSRGLFRLTKYKTEQRNCLTLRRYRRQRMSSENRTSTNHSLYLVNDLEECTTAIALGGNRFGSKWGTPDVFGIFRSRESDIVKTPLEVVSAEVKIDTFPLITAFGQACAYKLFSHRSYPVIPRESQPEDIGRLDALCVIFGVGLILFDATNPKVPNFAIRVRATKHEPDSFYVNQCVRQVADELHL